MVHVLRRPSRLAIAAFAAVLLLPAIAAAQAANPIPGIDAIVKKKPGGTAVPQKTDASGKFLFDHLTPGDYTVSFVRPAFQTRAAFNTTRSNIKHQVANTGSVQVLTLSIAIGSDTLPAYPITITGTSGRIVGTVFKAVPPTGPR